MNAQDQKKTVLVTGSNGLLGQKITELCLLNGSFNLIATSKGKNRFPADEGYSYTEMDVIDPLSVKTVIEKFRPDAVIHTAAMTNVDACHTERDLCTRLNVDAVKTIAAVCTKNNIQLVHLSTDFIFDGANGPYTEEDEPNPLSYYGQSKLAAERAVIAGGEKWVIIRTILVYGIVKDMSRSNIVLWAKGALEKGEPLNTVNDQWRMPTLAEDLAICCLLAVEKEAQGIYNVSGKNMMSISELVRKVADFWKLDKELIKEVSGETLNQAAKRPARTGFILDKAINELGYNPHSFEEGLGVLDRQIKDFVG